MKTFLINLTGLMVFLVTGTILMMYPKYGQIIGLIYFGIGIAIAFYYMLVGLAKEVREL
jgi:hypothetical protein